MKGQGWFAEQRIDLVQGEAARISRGATSSKSSVARRISYSRREAARASQRCSKPRSA